MKSSKYFSTQTYEKNREEIGKNSTVQYLQFKCFKETKNTPGSTYMRASSPEDYELLYRQAFKLQLYKKCMPTIKRVVKRPERTQVLKRKPIKSCTCASNKALVDPIMH